jgi:putative transposase
MPRTARASAGNCCYRALKRGNARCAVFHKGGDYQAFLKALGDGCQELPMPVLAYCLMTNYFHLDEHLLTVLRYVERNPVRAGLAECAESWPWSSARWWLPGAQRPLNAEVGPVPRPDDWLAWVNEPLTDAEPAAVRHSAERGAPFGGAAWAQQTAQRLGLEAALRPHGAGPGKHPAKNMNVPFLAEGANHRGL